MGVLHLKINNWYFRNHANITLLKLADMTGISKTKLNNIENNKVSTTLHQLEIISVALNVKITDLFESNYK